MDTIRHTFHGSNLFNSLYNTLYTPVLMQGDAYGNLSFQHRPQLLEARSEK